MGFYSSCPGSDKYVLTAPLFDQVTLRLPSGKNFAITTTNNSPKNTYVQQQKLNGEKVSRIWLSHEEISRGGTWELTLGASPRELREMQ
jgi:putative alpha-1,2-mannosidase